MEDRWFVAVGGLVASGKSTLARAIAQRLAAERIEADDIRHELLDRPTEILHEARWVRDLRAGFGDEVYRELLRRGAEVIDAGRSVVVDGCFPTAAWRESARRLARGSGARFLFVECHVPEAVAIERLSARDRAAGRQGWAELHRNLAEHYEPLDEHAAGEFVAVECRHDVEAVLRELEAHGLPPAKTHLPPSADRIQPLPRAITFDCWNTLLVEEDWPRAHAMRVSALHDIAAEAGIDVPREAAGRAFDTAWARHQDLWCEGVASGSREIAAWGLDALGVATSEQTFEHLVRLFEEASHTSHVKALDGARELLGVLVAADVPCGLVCDTGLTPGRQVRRLLDRAGLLEALTTQVFSDEIGVPKPAALTFTAALEPLGVAPEQALHVGDLRRTDVAGARAIGMHSVRIRDRYDDTGPEAEADYVVTSHTELRKALGL
jgi:predicted kinase/FMN phosphatase YigB (HAD superfamily)